jgi:hypothetical protein
LGGNMPLAAVASLMRRVREAPRDVPADFKCWRQHKASY